MMKRLLLVLIICISCEAVFVEDISEQSVILLAPVDNTELLKETVLFNWESIVEAETYELQVATPTFENASQIVLDTIISKTSYSKELVKGDYEWRIKAMNSGHNTAYSSAIFSIVSENDISKDVVELVAPVNNSQINSGNVSFNWNVVDKAESYQLQITTPSFTNATQIVLDTVVSSTTFSQDLTAGDYEWRVKAKNTEYETMYSINNLKVN